MQGSFVLDKEDTLLRISDFFPIYQDGFFNEKYTY